MNCILGKNEKKIRAMICLIVENSKIIWLILDIFARKGDNKYKILLRNEHGDMCFSCYFHKVHIMNCILGKNEKFLHTRIFFIVVNREKYQ